MDRLGHDLSLPDEEGVGSITYVAVRGFRDPLEEANLAGNQLVFVLPLRPSHQLEQFTVRVAHTLMALVHAGPREQNHIRRVVESKVLIERSMISLPEVVVQDLFGGTLTSLPRGRVRSRPRGVVAQCPIGGPSC